MEPKKAELVFVPFPGIGHLVSMVELAKVLIGREARLSITILLIKLPFVHHQITSYISSLSTTTTRRIRFVELSSSNAQEEEKQQQQQQPPDSQLPGGFFTHWVKSHASQARDAIAGLFRSNNSVRFAGLVIDMFCTPMIDVANQFGVPTYLFFTSGAATLGLQLHFPALHDKYMADSIAESDPDAEWAIPSFSNPVPLKVLPSLLLDKQGGRTQFLLDLAGSLREVKGIMVNTFQELESYALESLSKGSEEGIPPVYPVGPITHQRSILLEDEDRYMEIMGWLNNQPPSSVVLLCFGSMGSFEAEQVKEIAIGLEQSGHRFMWALRRSPTKDLTELPGTCVDPNEALPQGFLERTAEIGKVIGWAPQMEILSHQATGGFVSHCGWNSTLESLWCGVPVVTWPMYAEQQLNAFLMAREAGLAVEMTTEYRKEKNEAANMVIGAEVIKRGILHVMERESEVREKVKQMNEKARKAVMEGGSSYAAIGGFIQEVMLNMQ